MTELGRCESPWDLLEEQGRVVERQLEDLERAARRPLGPWLLCAAHCVALVSAAAALSLRGREVPWMCRELGRQYWFVAEMGIHKGVEISALARDDYRGQGVDLGCGDGIVGGILMRVCGLQPLVGVDQIQPEVAKHGYADFVQSDLQELPFDDARFDYAISVCVVEHLPDLAGAAREVRRILKPGGTWHFTTPSPRFGVSTLGYRFFRALGRRDAAEGHRRKKDVEMLHYHILSPDDWRRLLHEAGFVDVQVRPIFSRTQHLVYDLMSLQINLMHLYFADRLRDLGTRYPALQRALAWATAVVSANVALQPATDTTETHLHLTCRRP